MRILVVGAGAVGGFFGARLIQAGRDVTFLVRSGRAAVLRRDGLSIVGPHGEIRLNPRLVRSEEINSTYDLIFLSVKGYALTAAMEDFAPAVGADTVILPVLNGMRHLETLATRFGGNAVIGGLCRVVTQLDERGGIRQLADMQQLSYGELNGEITPRLRAINTIMQDARFEASLSPSILQAMWNKWVQLACLGAITCLFRGPVGTVAATPHGRELARAIGQESVGIAAACGFRPSSTLLADLFETITSPGSPLTSSMYRDLRAGASVEVEEILGDLIARGDEQAVTTPLLKAAYVALRIHQDSLEGKVPPNG